MQKDESLLGLYRIFPLRYKEWNEANNHQNSCNVHTSNFKILLKGENNENKFYEIDKAEYAFMIGTLPLSYQIALLILQAEKNLKITTNNDELDDFS